MVKSLKVGLVIQTLLLMGVDRSEQKRRLIVFLYMEIGKENQK